MNWPNWGDVARTLAQADADLKANVPLPAPEPMTAEERTAGIEAALAFVRKANAFLAAHPGVWWAARRILRAFAANKRRLWAAEALKVLEAAPGVLNEADKVLPTIAWASQAIEPAPTGLPGGWSGARGEIR